MQQILHNYKLRLTNLSQGNRSLCLSKLSKRRDSDVFEWGFLENDSPEVLFQKVLAGKNLRILSKLDARLEKANLLDKQLNLLYREVTKIEEETGTYNLFVGYPFVEGKFLDGTVARSPLLLLPVKLVRNLQNRPRWALEVEEDAEIQWNQTFFLAYEQYQQVRLKPEFWDEKLAYSDDWQRFINQLYEVFKKYEIEIDFNSDLFQLKIERFIDYSKVTLENFPLGKLKLMSNAVLGLFPQSDSALLQDYEEIEKSPFLYENHPILAENQAFKGLNLAKNVSESQLFYVSQLDPSQENVLLKAKEGKSLVVHGPPGTGKSQVIVNLLADAMANGKKVLVVSQKRAALDVVYKRLEAVGLSQFSVLIHDYQLDRHSIYQKIKQQIEAITQFQAQLQTGELSHIEMQFRLLAHQADEYNATFENLYQTLTQKQRCGLPLHDLYLLCDLTIENFPMEKVASRWTNQHLTMFAPKLLQLLDYAEFFDDNYAWLHRKSFHHFTYNDKKILLEKVNQLHNEIESLTPEYQRLSFSFNPIVSQERFYLFNNYQVSTCIHDFEKIEAKLKDTTVLRWLSAIYKDEWKPQELQKLISQLATLFEQLINCKMLKTLSWSSALDLLHHLNQYEQRKDETLRFFSLDYHKAVSFIKKVFQMNTIEWADFSYKQLQKEAKVFYQVWQIYAQTHESAFFQDFPIGDFFNLGTQWIQQKQTQFDQWREIEEIAFAKHFAPIFQYGELNQAQWQESWQEIQVLKAFSVKMKEKISEWEMFLHEKQIYQLKQLISNEFETNQTVLISDSSGKKTYISLLVSTLEKDFEELKTLDSMLAQLSHLEQETLQLLQPEMVKQISSFIDFSQKQVAQNAFLNRVKNSLYFYWIEEIEHEQPAVIEVSARGWDRKATEFAEILQQKQRKTAEQIQLLLQKQIAESVQYNRLDNPVTYRELHYQVGKKRQLWSVRKVVQQFWNQGLSTLMPCWLASPESVAAIFEMQPHLFDWVIFDEASQCFVEKSIPVLLRAHQAIIAGDSKQLPPFDMYSVRYEEVESIFVDTEKDILLGAQSILDLAKSTFEGTYLTWHYRSQEKELINFSNYAFYEGKLQMLPAATLKSENYPALEWLQVNGTWKNSQNLLEAEKVIELILQLIQRKDKPSIGVVTFNFYQQELIKDLIDKKLEELATTDTHLFALLQEALNRKQNQEFMGLFVKNIENVQGDERDIMIFSVAYAPNEDGKLITHFGLLNQQGGENRLNVAITRARLKIYVLCSFQPAELKIETAKNEGPKLLKNYLQYVKYVSEGNLSAANDLLTSNFQLNFAVQPNLIADFLAQYLTEKGFFVVRNIGDTRYKLDIGVKRNANDSDFLLGIECEGVHYFSGVSAKEREIYRTQLLQQKGWKTHRIHARNFWISREKEIEKVMKLLI